MSDQQTTLSDTRTDEQKEADRKMNNKMTYLSVAVLIIMAVLILYLGFSRRYFGLGFNLIIIGGFILFWVLSDIVRPRVAHLLMGKSAEQIKAFRMVMVLDLVGYAGIVYFVLSISNNSGFYGAIVYAICIMMKKRYLEEFNKSPEQVAKEEVKKAADAQTSAASKEDGDAQTRLSHLRTASSSQNPSSSRSLRDLASLSTADIDVSASQENPEEDERSESKQEPNEESPQRETGEGSAVSHTDEADIQEQTAQEDRRITNAPSEQTDVPDKEEGEG